MVTHDLRGRRWARLRWTLSGTGILLCLVGITADAIGLSSAPGFGTLQFVLASTGAALALLAWLGRRIVAAYRGTAIVVLNTAVLLGLVNLFAALLLRGPLSAKSDTAGASSLAERYGGAPWAETYAREYAEVHGHKKYHPFVIWRTVPFHGETINVDERGIRRTHGVQCTPDAYTVYVFGGSTTWGVGAPDWGTIPSYLAARLGERLGTPPCVVNFGEHGWVSTQSVVQLVAELDAGRVPDLVIFYDGINDSFTAALLGKAGVHYQLPVVAAKFEGREHPAITLLRRTSLYRLLVPQREPEGEGVIIPGADSLARAVVDVYLNNYRLVRSLANEFGFEYELFWQPNLLSGAKPAAPREQMIRNRIHPNTTAYLASVYALVEEATRGREHLHYIADAFADVPDLLYLDWMHLLPAGNRIIADRMMEALAQDGLLPAPAAGPEDR